MTLVQLTERGLTLIEYIIVIAIMAILLGAAAPNLSTFFRKQQADASAHQIWRQLQKTRELAVYSGRDMTLCGIDANNNCIRDNIRSLAIFFDANENRKIDADENVESLLEMQIEGNLRLQAGGTGRYIQYHHDGTANPLGSFIVCPKDANPRLIRRVTTNRAGRPYLARPGPDGVVLAFDGAFIDCS